MLAGQVYNDFYRCGGKSFQRQQDYGPKSCGQWPDARSGRAHLLHTLGLRGSRADRASTYTLGCRRSASMSLVSRSSQGPLAAFQPVWWACERPVGDLRVPAIECTCSTWVQEWHFGQVFFDPAQPGV